MNKAELIESIASKLDLSKADAEKNVDTLIDCILEGLKKEGSVQISGFGVFKVSARKERQGRNPKTGETITIKASKKVGFKAGKGLKELFQ